MAENDNRRNGIESACFWLGFLAYLAIAILCLVEMYRAKVPGAVLGFGLCSMLALAASLGVMMMLRWIKNGFYLLVLSAALSAIVKFCVLREDLLSSITLLIACAVWLIVLQLRSGGKSTWSRLHRGWDSGHCRHIYQLFAIVETILFTLTLISFGNTSNGAQDNSIQIIIHDKTEPPLSDSSRQPVENTDSTGKTSTKSPEHKESEPAEPKKESPGYGEKARQEKAKAKDNAPAKGENAGKPSYGLDAAAEYLDSHDVWVEAEMAKYDDLKNLNRIIIESLRMGMPLDVPSRLCEKSKRLSRLRHMYMRYHVLCRKERDRLRIRSGLSYKSLNYYDIIRSIDNAIEHYRRLEKSRKDSDSEPESVSITNP